MARLPVVNSDTDAWGTILSDYLSVEHAADGTHKHLAINAADFSGVDPTGTTDSTAGLKAALLAAAGKTLYIGPGTYLVSLAAHPDNAAIFAGLLLYGNCRIIGAGVDATIIKLASGQTQDGNVIENRHINTGTDQNIIISALTIDGNANSNTAHLHKCLVLTRVQRVHFHRVKFTNCRGTGSAGSTEMFHTSVSLSTDISYVDCECLSTATDTSTGFSANSSTGVSYVNCRTSGMVHGQGFTHNTCAQVQYTNCRAWLNGLYGFNSETSEEVNYANCIAGGRTANAATYPYAAQTHLGNAHGFIVSGSVGVDLANCHALYNSGQGLWVANAASKVNVNGGRFENNGAYGIFGTALDVLMSSTVRTANNTTGATHV